LTTRSRVALAEGEIEQAERDAYDALAIDADIGAHVLAPEVVEILGHLRVLSGSHREAARLFGASASWWQRIGAVRSLVHQAGVDASVAELCEAMGDSDFESAWAEGAAMSTDEVIAYAQRGRGGRRRPSSGWASLTPTELNVVRLVSEGLGNKDIATRLFVSHRTVQTHLTHVYAKVGLTSRVQLAQEWARHVQDGR
jgi:DNA-binding CsgD family transcriptional regulator